MRLSKYFGFILCAIWPLISYAQELPPVIQFPPEEYGADNQNWMISQDDVGRIFIANTKGLLEYNGATWNLYPSPNESIVRSVKVIGERIYTGLYMNFGYWARTSNGTLEYHSLSEELGIDIIDDEHFWNILEQHKWILFQSLDRILILNTEDNTVDSIEAEGMVSKVYAYNDEVYFQVMEEGLFRIENGTKVLVNDSDVAKNIRLIGLFQLGNSPVFISENRGFYYLSDEQLVPWETPADNILLQQTIYNALQMENGNLVLGSIANGIFILSSEGDLLYNLSQGNSLSNNTALSVFEDRDHNVWVGLDNGVNCVNMNAPLQNYTDQKGRLGTTYASVVHQGALYLGTNQGLFYKPSLDETEFSRIEGTEGQVWSLNLIDNTIFCGHNTGTFVIEGDRATLISNIPGAWDLRTVPNRPNLILQGNYEGFHTLEKRDGSWEYGSKMEGFDISARQFEFASENKVFVNHEYKGVFELILDLDAKQVSNYSKLENPKKGANSSLVKYLDTIYHSSRNGIFSYDPTSETFNKSENLSSIFVEDEYISGKLVSSGDKLWAFTKNYLWFISPEKLGSSYRIEKISIPQEIRNELEGYENITPFGDDQYIFGTSSGYLIIDPYTNPITELEISIHQVQATSFSESPVLLSLTENQEFEASQNNISFQYHVPEYQKYLLTEYQYMLEGSYDSWSPWSFESSVSFKNLEHGDYNFKVRAKTNNAYSKNIASYAFTIKRPWHLSYSAIAVYSFLGFLTVLLINYLYKRYYRKQRERILEKTTNELKLKELAAQKEIIQLKNEKLNQDIESRNRELAVSTMNMIRKNTLLNQIKSQLSKEYELSPKSSVIKLINDSINTQEEWKFFEEAFNHADKDFFKKLKELHPDLTPNDLRLCVYLRLNLSSKEIAPLLNISHRSVEIKRYRLRKKIGLDREINLNDYFIGL
ncbi:triple tyrosine motif-containing protein [Aureisphaera galaxeae]|uniref:helix-turn-helix and ligand-binding sensor domain-containing protein n=1 Tax=Aureisphaera galaxeae TaxID=1538023 RepID=UPI0023500D86|nr:triple tyrosine motif-containing protein [Aureisphaera galaxeae]MDC8005158.1 triple tyrosine motif-containing protein [Aureisphaera galaxeae]